MPHSPAVHHHNLSLQDRNVQCRRVNEIELSRLLASAAKLQNISKTACVFKRSSLVWTREHFSVECTDDMAISESSWSPVSDELRLFFSVHGTNEFGQLDVDLCTARMHHV